MAVFFSLIDGVPAFYETSICQPPSGAVEINYNDHAALLAGLSQGKRISLVDGIPTLTAPPPPTQEQIIARMESMVQRHLDSVVGDRGYDSIYTACTYADEPAVAKFQAEGIAARRWRSQVWAYCHHVLDDVLAGRRAMPTDLIAELPQIVWQE